MKKQKLMKKVGLLLLAAAVILPLNAWGQPEQKVAMKSEEGDSVYGPIYPDSAKTTWTVPEPGVAALWGGPSKAAVEVVELNPEMFSESGAQWISTAARAEDGGAQDSYRWFRDEVTAPCTALGTSPATLNVDSDDELEVFLNGASLATSMPGFAQYTVGIEPGETKTFDFVVKNNAQTDTTGVIYAVEAAYDLPAVLWRPPLTTSANTNLKYGRTLPIKFKFLRDGKVLRVRQDIYVTVSDSTGKTKASFYPGIGARGVRFARGAGQYIVNFKTKDSSLVIGETYTVNVHDACSGDVLGSRSVNVVGKKIPVKKGRKVK